MFDNIERIQTRVWTRKKELWQGKKACGCVGYFATAPANREDDDRANILFCANIYLSVIFCRSARLFCETFSNGTFFQLSRLLIDLLNRLGTHSLVFKMCTWGKERRLERRRSGRDCLPSPTWKWRMIVQMRPRVSLGLPSTMSSPLMLTSLISLYLKYKKVDKDTFDRVEESDLRNLSAVSTFWMAWKRIRPRSRGWKVNIRWIISLFSTFLWKEKRPVGYWPAGRKWQWVGGFGCVGAKMGHFHPYLTALGHQVSTIQRLKRGA